MGVRIIESNSPTDSYAVIYCSVSMTAFGPVFSDAFEAEEFLEWLPEDARRYSSNELDCKYAEFREHREELEKEEEVDSPPA